MTDFPPLSHDAVPVLMAALMACQPLGAVLRSPCQRDCPCHIFAHSVIIETGLIST
jgi:hypothetical protein